tara:strand:+ start:446 stop:715 length:270 start_codon:yes stop_codon:yes gene_type:complete
MYGVKSVALAPPRLALKKFGGRMTIEEFRGTKTLACQTIPDMSAEAPAVQPYNRVSTVACDKEVKGFLIRRNETVVKKKTIQHFFKPKE